MSESCIASAFAEIMVYNDGSKKWQSPLGSSDSELMKVEILQHIHKAAFRIVSYREMDRKIILNCNIHQKLKYHSATPTFHQWRDEHKQVYGLNFRSEADARMFVSIIGQAIDHLTQEFQGHSENVYQDPHQHIHHLHHIQSAPSFSNQGGNHDDNQNAINPNFRKLSQHGSVINGGGTLTQQQRRASQSSNASSGAAMMSHQDHVDARNGFTNGYHHQAAPSTTASTIPPAPPPPMPPSSSIPPAPPPPPGGAIAPISSSAPPPPPPPPPNFNSLAGGSKGTSLADQLKMRGQQLNKTGPSSTTSSTPTKTDSDRPAPPPSAGNLMSELTAHINKRKMTQAKADAVDSKSNTSNGSSDSGCGTAPPQNGLATTTLNGSTAKKWPEPKTNGCDSPKTHRKVPSVTSLPSDDIKLNGNSSSSSSGVMTNEMMERFKSELMVEVRLEINKAKQEIIEALRQELSRR